MSRSQPRIGLALSGGGFRAAAFHIGVLKTLYDLGLYTSIRFVSSVSGGAIVGAAIGLNQDRTVLDVLEVYLMNHSPLGSSFLRGLFDFSQTRTDKLADSYDEALYHGARLSDLKGFKTVINSVSATTGHPFYFEGGNAKARLGEYETGFVSADSFSVARAVAASGAYPVFLSPLELTSSEYSPARTFLVDGGVYDNLGIHSLLREEDLDLLIVSDAGAPLRRNETPGDGVFAIESTMDIMMEQMRGMQIQRLTHLEKGKRAIWFSIDSKGEGDNAEICSRIPTGLSALPRNDLSILQRHAETLLRARLSVYAPEWIS